MLPVLEYSSAVWCSAADTHLKLLDRAVSGARLLTGGVFECDFFIVDPWQFCMFSELCALVNKPSGASAGASDLKY